jgi:hypothetical protein
MYFFYLWYMAVEGGKMAVVWAVVTVKACWELATLIFPHLRILKILICM